MQFRKENNLQLFLYLLVKTVKKTPGPNFSNYLSIIMQILRKIRVTQNMLKYSGAHDTTVL